MEMRTPRMEEQLIEWKEAKIEWKELKFTITKDDPSGLSYVSETTTIVVPSVYIRCFAILTLLIGYWIFTQ